MTYGDRNDWDPLLVRRSLRRPDNVDGPALSDETWPAMPAPPYAAPPPLSRAQRDRTAAALNWPTLKWFTQKPPASPRPSPPPSPSVPSYPQRPNAGPSAVWVTDYPTEVFPYPPVPQPAAHGAAADRGAAAAHGAAAARGAASVTATPAQPSKRRRRRRVVLAGAAFAALVGIGGIGFAEFVADDGGQGSAVGLPLIPAFPPGDALPSSAATSVPVSPELSLPAPARGTTTGAGGLGPDAGATTAAVPPEGLPVAPAPSGSLTSPLPPGEPRAFAPPSPDPPSSTGAAAAVATGAVTGPGGLCLAAPGSRALTATCDGTEAQSWTVGADGTLRVAGRCADGGANSVSIVTCGEAATSRWTTGSNRSVVNVGTGECLTDPAGGARAGNAVTLTACNGGTNQRWSLP